MGKRVIHNKRAIQIQFLISSWTGEGGDKKHEMKPPHSATIFSMTIFYRLGGWTLGPPSWIRYCSHTHSFLWTVGGWWYPSWGGGKLSTTSKVIPELISKMTTRPLHLLWTEEQTLWKTRPFTMRTAHARGSNDFATDTDTDVTVVEQNITSVGRAIRSNSRKKSHLSNIIPPCLLLHGALPFGVWAFLYHCAAFNGAIIFWAIGRTVPKGYNWKSALLSKGITVFYTFARSGTHVNGERWDLVCVLYKNHPWAP